MMVNKVLDWHVDGIEYREITGDVYEGLKQLKEEYEKKGWRTWLNSLALYDPTNKNWILTIARDSKC